jgi:hypothetical protein
LPGVAPSGVGFGWAAAGTEPAGLGAAGFAAGGLGGLATGGLTCASAGESAAAASAPNSINDLEGKLLPRTNLFILNGYPALPNIAYTGLHGRSIAYFSQIDP